MLALSTLLLYHNYFTTDDDVQDSISSLAFVFASGSAGVLLSAFVTPPVTRRIGGWRLVAALLAAVAVAVLAFGLPFAAPLLVIAVFVVNIASQGIKIVVDTAVQHECADAYRGRVFSINDTAFNLAYVVGMFAAALSVPEDGHSPSLRVAVAFGYAAVAVWYAVVAGRWAEQAGDPSPPRRVSLRRRPRPDADLPRGAPRTSPLQGRGRDYHHDHRGDRRAGEPPSSSDTMRLPSSNIHKGVRWSRRRRSPRSTRRARGRTPRWSAHAAAPRSRRGKSWR